MPWGMVLVTETTYTTPRLGMAAGRTHTIRDVLGRAPVRFDQFARR